MKRLSLFFISFIFAVSVAFTASFGYVKADEVVAIDDLTVHFIDIGQGDACIIELPDNRTMLIDAGENKNSVKTKLDSYINDNIKDDNGNVYFDFVIMTHSDSDHIGSMEHILKTYDVHTVYRPNQACTYNGCDDPAGHGEGAYGFWGDKQGTKPTVTYHKALESAYENAEEVIVTNPYDNSQNQITSTNDKAYTINFYSPISSYYSDNNNYSPIVVIEYNGRKVVLTGDAEKENEAEFVKAVKDGDGRYADFKDFSADVIKLGHHGSRTSSSEDYLNIVTKAALRSGVFVIISCGEDNSYGHPHPEILERLSSLGFVDDNILRTDKLGDIVISISKVDGEYKAVYGGKTGADNAGNSGQGSSSGQGGSSGQGSSSGQGGSSGQGSSSGQGGSSGQGSNSGQSNQEQDEEDDIITLIRKKFNSLELYMKIIVVVVIIIVVILVLYFLIRPALKKKGKNDKNNKSKGKGKKK